MLYPLKWTQKASDNHNKTDGKWCATKSKH